MKVGLVTLLMVASAFGGEIGTCKLDAHNGCRDYSSAAKCGITDACKSLVWIQSASNGTLLCDWCLDDVKNLEKFVSANTTKEFVKYDLLATCRLIVFEAARNRCRANIEDNFDQIYDDIVNELDPTVVCNALHFCRPKDTDQDIFDSDECKLDGENACKDYTTAEKCHATSYCKLNVWKEPVNNRTTCCKKCLETFGKLEKFLEANATYDEIKRDVLATCSLLFFRGQRQRCRDMVNQNFDQIYNDLEKRLDPKVVCRALRICQSEESPSVKDEAGDCKLDSENACKDYSTAEKCHATSECKTTVWQQPVNNETKICEMCLDFIGKIETFVKSNATHDAIKEDLLLACSLLPFEVERCQCTAMINESFEQIYQDLVDQLDPDVICRAMRLCHSKTPTPFLDEKPEADASIDACTLDGENACRDYTTAHKCYATSFCKMMLWKQPVDNQTALCKMCLSDIKNLQDFIEANSTRQYVRHNLAEICDGIPFAAPRNKCNTLVDENFDTIYQDIVDELDPSMVCRALHLCCSKDTEGILVEKMKKSMEKFGVPIPQNSEKVMFNIIQHSKCDLCKESVEAMEKWGRFFPKSILKEELEQFCQTLMDPAEIKECRDRIDRDLDKIYHAIVAQTDPALVCQELGTCSGKATRIQGKMKAGFERL